MAKVKKTKKEMNKNVKAFFLDLGSGALVATFPPAAPIAMDLHDKAKTCRAEAKAAKEAKVDMEKFNKETGQMTSEELETTSEPEKIEEAEVKEDVKE